MVNNCYIDHITEIKMLMDHEREVKQSEESAM